MSTLNIVVIGDIHYVNNAHGESSIPERKGRMGRELLRRALYYSRNQLGAQGIVLLGDIIEDGLADKAGEDLYELKKELDEFQIKYFVVPGNHDGDFKRIYEIFGKSHGMEEIDGVKLFFFHDKYGEGDVATRDPGSMEELKKAAMDPGPLIVFQHNPIYPHIESSYPYNLRDSHDIQREYEEIGVTLSVSAHYHKGYKMMQEGSVKYVTVPALCEAPFRFLHIQVEDHDVQTRKVPLAPSVLGKLQDLHIHSQFAYCAEDVDMESVVTRAKFYGLDKMALIEHTSHLYTKREDLPKAKPFRDPRYIRRVREQGTDRMPIYKELVRKVRSDFVRVGLEVDCAFDGSPIILEEDMTGWDLLVGAVHRLPCGMKAPEREIIRAFLELHETFLASGLIQVLAHPFRIFFWAKMRPPKELYRPLVRMLSENGVAAEINFHSANNPDPDFFQLCLEEGVKLSLGSDAHNLAEVGHLTPHIEFLKKLGVDPEDPKELFLI